MFKEKLYELNNWKGVVHTTLNPQGPGAVRIHLIPPKFSWFKTVPSVVILNGQDVLPINESWAILLTELIKQINKYEHHAVSQEEMNGIMHDTFHNVRKVYNNVEDSKLRDDISVIMDTFEDIARGKEPDYNIGVFSLADYSVNMTAPHRMDLMISAMTEEGNWHCNQRCLHCYAAGQDFAETKELTTKEWKDIIDKCREDKIPQITFTGGEPTMRQDLVELIDHARWFVTRLNTNGVLLTKELAKKLMDVELDSVQITLYSHKPEVHNVLVGANNFHKTLDGIKNALEAGLNISINTPLCSLNSDYDEMLKFLHELGIEYVTCSGLIVTGNAENSESRETQLSNDDIYEVVKKAAKYAFENGMEMDFTSPGWIDSEKLNALGIIAPSCGACLSNMAISPDGNVIPCQSWLSDKSLGNILTTSWKNIWNSSECRKIRSESARMEGICPLRS